MLKVILDTDFLIKILEWKVPLFQELDRTLDFPYKVYILDRTLDELKGKKLEKLALKFIKEKINIIKTKTNKNVDKLLLTLNNKQNIICTQDKELKEKLKKAKFKIVTIRQKRYLQNVL